MANIPPFFSFLFISFFFVILRCELSFLFFLFYLKPKFGSVLIQKLVRFFVKLIVKIIQKCNYFFKIKMKKKKKKEQKTNFLYAIAYNHSYNFTFVFLIIRQKGGLRLFYFFYWNYLKTQISKSIN